ncbi:13364_t:CDS:2, partial [Cetraspora pellucida]
DASTSYTEQNERPSITNLFDIVNGNITELVEKYFTFKEDGLEEFNNASTTQTKNIEHGENNKNIKYRILSKEALDEINIMTKHGNLSLTVQKSLLKARFFDLNFQDQDLANAIQKAKSTTKINNDNRLIRLLWMSLGQVDLWLRYYNVVVNNNTARTNQYQMPLGLFIVIDNKCKTHLACQVLISDETIDTHVWILEHIKKAVDKVPIVMFTDRDPALDAAIPIVFSETYSAHCIFHIAQNLPKNLKAKLGINWNNFIKQFYECQRWNKLLNDFPMTKDYLLRVLDLKCRSWARAYLYRIFTVGIESTSRVESYNWVIKQQLKTNSTLCELADRLDERLRDEVQWNQFHDYRQAVMMNTIPIARQDLFPKIINVIDEYLTEPISNAIKMEMSQCLFVSANEIEPSFEELHCEQRNENYNMPERPMASEVSDNTWEIQTNKTSDQTEESKTETETEESQDMNEVNLENVKNLNKVSTRG